mmetsp:Transcript_63626/g.151799  ORF Transcript_63626/g.151799 Transcript_63626/m.151799 type:complete len:435 (+) Transcript_63626:72-1376(+)
MPLKLHMLRGILALQLLATTVYCKAIRSSVELGGSAEESRWQYISKFGYGIGTGSYKVRARLSKPEAMQPEPLQLSRFQLDLRVYLDEDFEHMDDASVCSKSAARRTHPVWLNANGAWSDWREGNVGQVVRPHIWYFALTDCQGSRLGNATRLLDFEFEARQPDASHFSYEMRLMPWACLVALAGLSVFLLRFVARCRDFRSSAGSLHPVIWVLAAAVLLHVASQALHAAHLCSYARDGQGLALLDTLGETVFMLSQVLLTTLLIGIASGYTLLDQSSCSLEMLKAALGLVCLLHILLVSGGKLLRGDLASKHHEHEGIVGAALLVLRMCLFTWFALALRRTREQGGIRLEAFLAKFAGAGSLYFLAYPCLVVVCQIFAPYLRHPLLQIGLTAMQVASSSWLTSLFLSRGEYFKASVLSSSKLPGGCTSYGKLL